jgi:hypothetical protein
VTAESFELTTEDVSGADKQQRARLFYEIVDPSEIDVLLQQAPQQILP